MCGLWITQRRTMTSSDPLSRDPQVLLRQLKRLGLKPAPGETLEALAKRAALSHPPLARPVEALVASHAERRYAPAVPAAAQREARQRWQLALQEVKRLRIDAISRGPGSAP